jgi:hypothetical protein
MPQLTREDARSIAAKWRIPLDRDFHALNSATVESILGAADERRYRKPANANGSRARCFFQYLSRAASREAE